MNELVTRCLEENATNWLAEFPKELLDPPEKELITFILQYEAKWGDTPTVKQVSEAFAIFIPFIFSPSIGSPKPLPLGVVYEQTLSERLLAKAEEIVYKAQREIIEEQEIPIDLLNKLQEIYSLSTGTYKYSTFDRDKYFRRGKTSIPFQLINNHIGGLANGDYMLLIGRLGTGKSTIAQWFAKNAWEQGKRILFVSTEMLPQDVFSRIDAMVAKFNPLKLRRDKSDVYDDLSRAKKIAMGEGRGEILVPKNRLLTPAEIGSFAKTMNIDQIIVDGAYLLSPSSGSFGKKWETVATVSNELKQMALDMEVPLIATSQIKRGASGENGYDPEDISFSDALGQDADFIIAIWPNKVVTNRSELQLIKNRYGGICSTQIMVNFDEMTVIDEAIEGEYGTKKHYGLSEWTS